MKKKIFVFIIFILLLVVSGCSKNPSDVKLLNERQAARVARTYFGDATYMGVKENSSDRIVYIFKDNKLGFEYNIVSFRKSLSLDGSSFGYTSRTSSDFGIEYYNYIISSLSNKVSDIEKKYNVKIGNDDGWRSIKSVLYETRRSVRDCDPTTYAFYSVYSNNSNDREKAGEELLNYIKEYDTRNYFKTCGIWLRENELNDNNVYPRRGIIQFNK